MSAKLIKIVTGEEVLSNFDEIGETLMLSNPVRLQLQQRGVAMVPLSPFMKEGTKIPLAKKEVLWMIDADEDVVNAYNQQYGSGIVVAPPGLTLG